MLEFFNDGFGNDIVPVPAFVDGHDRPGQNRSVECVFVTAHVFGPVFAFFPVALVVFPVFGSGIQPFFASNNAEMIRCAALDGTGIAMAVDFLVAEDLAAGRLVQVLPEFSLPDLPVSLIYPPSRTMTAALRTFLDFLTRSPR